MATVITNLLSAIPVFGQDIVELIITKYLICFVSFSNLVKANILPVLPAVGTVSIHALKKGKKIRLEKKEYLSIPSQFIAFLTGLIDGEGYIQITKTTKGFITIKLAIQLHLDDLSTLEYIHSVLKLGKITIYRDMKSPSCKLVINRTELQEVIFPLLLHHGIFFLTNTRRVQFDLAMYIFKFNIKIYDQITDPLLSPFLLQREEGRNLCALARLKAIGRQEIKTKTKKFCIPTLIELPKTALDYINLPFFKNWIVGFTVAEGSFFIKQNNDGCFQLKQRIHVQLFEAFKLLFNTKRKILTEQNMYNQFSVSSNTDIQTVINFFSFSGLHPLIGLKSIQYLKWLNNLRNSSRYTNLNFPN